MLQRTQILNPTQEGLEKAAKILRSGGLVAFPTETVYGLGADAFNDKATKRVFNVKGRPSNNPLIVHVGSLSQAQKLVQFSSVTQTLAKQYWPGSLTLILPKKKGTRIPDHVSSSTHFLAVRVPENLTTLQFLRLCKCPIVGPSANLSGRVSPTNSQHVLEDLDGKIEAVIDGGQCRRGLESTILTYVDNQLVLLRQGAIPLEQIQNETGLTIDSSSGNISVLSPGTKSKHYSPLTKVRLNARKKRSGEVFIGFRNSQEPYNFNLSEKGCLEEAAKNLYSILRNADQYAQKKNKTSIAIAPIPNTRLGLTINDRLSRAALAK